MKVEFKKSKLHGIGIFAMADIQADEIIEICPIIMLNAKDTNEIDKTHLYDYYFSWREQGSAISLGYAHSIIILTNPMLNTIKIL